MFKLIVAPVMALFMLVGCQSGGGIDVASVQNALKSACGFQLIAASAASEIQSLVGTIPGLNTASAIANAICSSLNAQMAAKRKGAVAGQVETVIVSGVPVHGRFVR